MRTRFFVAAALFCAALSCQAAPPSAEQVETLLTVTRVQTLMNSLFATLEQSMRQGMQQMATKGSLTPEQQAVLDETPRRFVRVMREEMSWEKLKPIYIEIYQETLTSDEVDAMTAFYRTPAGVAVIEKMPLIMQRSNERMQVVLRPMLEKMRASMDEAMRDAKVKP